MNKKQKQKNNLLR